MSEITIQQLKTINEYRQSHNIGSVYSNEAVADMIKEEMEKTGAVYPGFEALIGNCNKNQKINGSGQVSLFECNNEDVEIQETSRIPTEQELNTIKFLQDLLISARQSIDEFNKCSKWHTDVASWCFNHKYRKQDVEAALKDTERDIEILLKAAQGQLYDKHIMVGDTAVSLPEAFKRCRGVEYNEAKISACQKKAQNFSYVKSYYEKITMFQEVLQKMNAISGINVNELHGTIISALNTAGIKSKPMLEQIIQKYFKPDENYTNDIKLEKNNDGNWRIKIKHKDGHWCDMSYDQLKNVSSEICKVLDMQFCDEMGLEYDKEFSSEKMHELAYEEFDRQQKEYEEAFRQAYGSEDLKVLADNYIVACQKATATLDTIEQVIMMGLMFTPGGGIVATSAKLALTGIMITNPIQTIDKIASENGMSREDWQEYGKQVMMNAAYMGVGMKVGKVAENASALYKTRAIFNAYKQSGKTVENAMMLIKGNANNFPNELIKSINTIDKISKALQVTTEVAMDITTTYAMNEMFIGEGLSAQDWIMSVATAIAGGALQKSFASMRPEQRIAYLMDAFKDFNITKTDAVNILKQVSDIESGKVKTEKTKTITDAVRESAKDDGNISWRGDTEYANFEQWINADAGAMKIAKELLADEKFPNKYIYDVIDHYMDYKQNGNVDLVIDLYRLKDSDPFMSDMSNQYFYTRLREELSPEHHQLMKDIINDSSISSEVRYALLNGQAWLDGSGTSSVDADFQSHYMLYNSIVRLGDSIPDKYKSLANKIKDYSGDICRDAFIQTYKELDSAKGMSVEQLKGFLEAKISILAFSKEGDNALFTLEEYSQMIKDLKFDKNLSPAEIEANVMKVYDLVNKRVRECMDSYDVELDLYFAGKIEDARREQIKSLEKDIEAEKSAQEDVERTPSSKKRSDIIDNSLSSYDKKIEALKRNIRKHVEADEFDKIIESCTVDGKISDLKLQKEYGRLRNIAELRKYVHDENQINQILEACTFDNEFDIGILKQRISYFKLKYDINNIEKFEDCENFEKALSQTSLSWSDKVKLSALLEQQKEMLKIKLEMEPDDAIKTIQRIYDKENQKMLRDVLVKVTSYDECIYLEDIIRRFDEMRMSTEAKEILLSMVRDKKSEFSADDSHIVIDIERSRIFDEFIDCYYEKLPKIVFKDYPTENHVFNYLTKVIREFERNNEGCKVNLYPVGTEGVRGRNIVTISEEAFYIIKEQGVKYIIDLRDDCELKNIKLENVTVTEKDGKIYLDNIEYVVFPVDHNRGTHDMDIIKNLGKLFDIMENGSFYIGCANGLHRTDFTLAINYVLNVTTKDIPVMRDSRINDLSRELPRVYDTIIDLMNSKTKEELNELGLTEQVINKLPKTREEFEKRVMDIIS